MTLAAWLLAHGDDPQLDLVYFWAAILIVLTPVIIFGTIGALVLRKIWQDRRNAGEQGAQSGR
jgi:hypothetical protein